MFYFLSLTDKSFFLQEDEPCFIEATTGTDLFAKNVCLNFVLIDLF